MKMAIKEVLKAQGRKQGRFADELGVSRGYMSLLVNGQRDPSPGLLRRMAEILNVPVGALYDGPDQALSGFEEPAALSLGMPDPEKNALLKALGIRGKTVEVMEAARSFLDLGLMKGDKVFVELDYQLALNDVVVLNLTTDAEGSVTRFARWLDPWFIGGAPDSPPLKDDGSGVVAVLGKVLAASRAY